MTGKQVVAGWIRVSRKSVWQIQAYAAAHCRVTVTVTGSTYQRNLTGIKPKARSCTQPAHSATGSRESDGSESFKWGWAGSGSMGQLGRLPLWVFSVGKYAFPPKKDRSPLGSVTRRYLGGSPSFLVTLMVSDFGRAMYIPDLN